TSSSNDRILRFTASGTFAGDYVPAGSGGMDDPYRLAFGPNGDLYVTSLGISQILQFGTESEAIFTVSISSASSLSVSLSFNAVDNIALAGSDYTATAGTVAFAPGATSTTIRVPLLDDSIFEGAETFSVNLSNPVGGVITDGQGVGTIIDND